MTCNNDSTRLSISNEPWTGMGMPRNQILLVDDDPKLLRVLTLRLEAEGYGVIATASGEEALQRLDHVRPQMVLADLRMPDLDGIELLVRIQGRHPTLPVPLLSAHSALPAPVRATHAGAVSFLPKPLHPPPLTQRHHPPL